MALRIVGPGSKQLQPDLYRSGAGDTAATQKRLIFDEYKLYRQLYMDAGGRALPLDACQQAAEYYNSMQRLCVKRSQSKKTAMAACFWYACLRIGFSPAKTEIADFLQLKTRGIARGTNLIRSFVADGKMDIEVDADPCASEIKTLFIRIDKGDPSYEQLRETVHKLVQIAVENNICSNSVLRSKVAGITYVVLCRCKDRALISHPPVLAKFCQGHIRKNTIDCVIRDLESFHSYFKDAYALAGLDSSPW
jgi:hypothetical protein